MDATGITIIRPFKHMYGRSFALYALAEFALASGRRNAMELALKQFEVMEEKAHDNAVVRKDLAACTDKYERDWTPRLDNNWNRISYGHDIENIWLMHDAMHVAGISISPYLDLFRQIFSYSRKNGYDEKHGGFFDSGPLHAPADQRQKVWWVQSKALVSSLRMYTLTRDPSYLAVFRKTWDFVNKYQTDWEHGEWHSTVNEKLVGSGDKGNNWKSAYHNGRAMIECIRILESLR